MSCVKRWRGRKASILVAALVAVITLSFGFVSPARPARAAVAVNMAAHLVRTPHPTVRVRRWPRVRLRRLGANGVVATISSTRFSSRGGVFAIRISGLTKDSRCRLSSGRGVRLRGVFACGKGSFVHRGRALANRSSVTLRWSVHVIVDSAGRTQRFGWVLIVRPDARPATATAPISTLPSPTTTTTTTVPSSTTTTTTTTPTTTTTTTTVPPSPPSTSPPVIVPTQPIPTTTTPSALPGNRSSNWSGYYLPSAAGSTTDVQATWTVPALNCSATPNGDVAEWIGVDGATSSDLFQTGTETSCSNGTQTNEAWVEELPATAQMLRAVATGDVISAHVWQVSPGYWQFTIDDVTQNWQESYSQPVAYSGPESSADWIVEDPTDGTSNSLLPFADFGIVNFSNLSVNSVEPSLSLESDGIEMAQGGSVLAIPAATTGDGFSVSYE